jgi:hypothetical protein
MPVIIIVLVLVAGYFVMGHLPEIITWISSKFSKKP